MGEREEDKKEGREVGVNGGREEKGLEGRNIGRVREGDSEFLLLKLVAKKQLNVSLAILLKVTGQPRVENIENNQ